MEIKESLARRHARMSGAYNTETRALEDMFDDTKVLILEGSDPDDNAEDILGFVDTFIEEFGRDHPLDMQDEKYFYKKAVQIALGPDDDVYMLISSSENVGDEARAVCAPVDVKQIVDNISDYGAGQILCTVSNGAELKVLLAQDDQEEPHTKPQP